MASQNNLLGYIVIQGGEGQLRGITLVTDARGIPADFKYTDLIRPKKLERILYGDAFDTYVKQELILESLLDAVDPQPQLWICSDSELLAPLREISKAKTVLLEESPHVPLDAPGSIENLPEPGAYLIQAEAHGNPLRAEFPAGVRSDEIQQVSSMLTEFAETMTLLEPFTRIQRLMSALAAGNQ